QSATNRIPFGETAIPEGWLNLAKEPFPSVHPLSPGQPQRVLTVPSGVICLIVWLLVSVTKRVPSREQATPKGWLNLASEPLPSVDPFSPGEPQRVVGIVFDGVIFLIVLLPVSATKRVPLEEHAIPKGNLNLLSEPSCPHTVVTFLSSGVIFL